MPLRTRASEVDNEHSESPVLTGDRSENGESWLQRMLLPSSPLSFLSGMLSPDLQNSVEEVVPENPLLHPTDALRAGVKIRHRDHTFFYRLTDPEFPNISAFKKEGDEDSVGGISCSPALCDEPFAIIDTIMIDRHDKNKGMGSVLKALAKTLLKEEGYTETRGCMALYLPTIKDGNFVLGPIEINGLATFLSGMKAPDLTAEGSMDGPCFKARISRVFLSSCFDKQTNVTSYSLVVELTTDLTSHVDREEIELDSKEKVEEFSEKLRLPTSEEFEKKANLTQTRGFVFKQMEIPLP
jgi:hypothetical protein